MRILIVEDDELVAQALLTILSAHNYAIERASDGQAALELIQAFDYDLVILDVVIPRLDGIRVCQAARSLGYQMPILLLTGRDSHHDRAVGLDAGADDYVIKPFNEEELVARIRALLRRGGTSAQSFLEWGELKLEPSSCEVTYGTTLLTLTPKEYALLELFLRNHRRVFSCGAILEHLWAYEDTPGEEAVRTHIKGLRQKLKAAGAPTDLIETVYGIGYRLKPIATSDTPLSEAKTGASIEQELRSKLAGVWAASKARVSDQIAVLEQAASKQKISQTLRQQAKQQAHTLVGALGTFGFAHGSQLARKIEQLLSIEQALKPKELKQFRELIAELRRTIDLPAIGVLKSSIPSELCEALIATELFQDSSVSESQPLIVVVDRDRDFITALKAEAPQWNYRIVEIPDPQETGFTAQQVKQAIRSATLSGIGHEAPSGVLLDLDCFASIEEGYALLSEFSQQTPPIPVLVFTSENQLTERLEITRRGGRLLLQKPVDAAQIFEAIAQTLKRTTQAKVLVVDDDPQILSALKTLLEPWGLKVYTLADARRFWDVLEACSPDLLVLDIEFPEFNGIELCKVVRNDLRWSHVPILFLTAHSDSPTVTEVFAAGADDFVAKPIVGPELVTRIVNRLERMKLMRHLAETDPLTGVENRYKSSQTLDAFLKSAERYHQSVAIAILDVDQLRLVNDQYGHAVGDTVLRKFGQLLRQSFCGEDVVARWGGEEFVIGMYGMSREDGLQRIITVLEAINQQAFTTEDGNSLQVTFSAGVAQYPEDGTDLQSLHRAADLALRQAKQIKQQTRSHGTHAVLPATIPSSKFAIPQF